MFFEKNIFSASKWSLPGVWSFIDITDKNLSILISPSVHISQAILTVQLMSNLLESQEQGENTVSKFINVEEFSVDIPPSWHKLNQITVAYKLFE
jgi:hypothetical protein